MPVVGETYTIAGYVKSTQCKQVRFKETMILQGEVHYTCLM